jgi:hypothetical protein
MVYSGVGISTHKALVGDTRSLDQRWAEVIEEASRAIPVGSPDRSVFQLFRSEDHYWAIKDAITRAKQQAWDGTPQPDEKTLSLRAQLFDQIARYNRVWLLTRSLQAKLRHSRGDTWHRILADLPDQLFDRPIEISNSVDQLAQYTDYETTKEAVERMVSHLANLDTTHSKLATAEQFDALPADQKALALVESLSKRVEALEHQPNRKGK